MEALDRFGQQAWSMLTSPAARDAFDLDREPAPVRERYGYFPAYDPGASNRCGCPAWSLRILLAHDMSASAEPAVGLLLGAAWPPGSSVHVLSSPVGIGHGRSSFANVEDVRLHALPPDTDARGPALFAATAVKHGVRP